MKITFNNPQRVIWYGTVRTNNPLTLNEDTINRVELKVLDSEHGDGYEDLDIPTYLGHDYLLGLKAIKSMIEQNWVSETLIDKIEEEVDRLINLVPTDFVEIDDYTLDEGEYYFIDFEDEFTFTICKQEEATHSAIDFQGELIVLPNIIDNAKMYVNNVKEK